MAVMCGYGRRWAGLYCLTCHWGRSLRDGNALTHLVSIKCFYFKILFIVVSKDEPCTYHSLAVRLTLCQAVYATSSASTDSTAGTCESAICSVNNACLCSLWELGTHRPHQNGSIYEATL